MGFLFYRVWHRHVPCGVVWHEKEEMSLRLIPCFSLCLLPHEAGDMVTASHYDVCLFLHSIHTNLYYKPAKHPCTLRPRVRPSKSAVQMLLL